MSEGGTHDRPCLSDGKNNHGLRYYFAYGSNMNHERMTARGVEYEKRELARLPGYLFVMNKVKSIDKTAAANIIEHSSASVYGALYTCSGDEVFDKLDKYEGVKNRQYFRHNVNVYLVDGESKVACTYIAHHDVCKDDLSIAQDYLDHVLQGQDILPTEYFKYLKSFETFVSNGLLSQGMRCFSGNSDRIGEIFHFAYGASMDPQRMADRGFAFQTRELARIPGYKFIMNKVRRADKTAAANIIRQPDSEVYGALYTFATTDVFAKLDKYEGVKSNHYYKKQVRVYLASGEMRMAYVYIAHECVCKDNLKINSDYFHHILQGEDILPSDYFQYLKSFQTHVL
eukprot:gene10786-11940_t